MADRLMRVRFPGLIQEQLPSGAIRWRVRKEGDAKLRITLHVDPEHPRFGEHYHAARAGIEMPPEPEEISAIRGSVGWLIDLYDEAMGDMLARGQLHKSTVHQRRQFLAWMRGEVGEYSAAMPQPQMVILRDKKADTPGAADNFVKAVRAMYEWGKDRGHVKANPASGINKINRGKGARPWTLDDLQQFRDRHPAGTTPHLALTLFMFTAGRIGDVVRLGRGNEVRRGEVTWLDWQPEKKGSARVQIPMLPPLYKATRAQAIIGPTYLMSQLGKPFGSKNALGIRFREWCDQAGLPDLSSHGIRKAAGELLALHGASQYEITAIHGHNSARTSEIYTKGYDRMRAAESAMKRLESMEW